MELNSSQKAAIECLDHNLQIVACAGSGKTEVISRRLANIIIRKKDVSPNNIVAFTFTEKAAENMKQRVQRNMSELGIDVDINDMYVGTIHAFCYQILKTYVPAFNDLKVLDTVKEHLFIMKHFKKCGAERLGLFKSDAALFSTCIDKMICAYETWEEWPKQDLIVFEQYKSLLYEKGFINFSLMIHELLKHLNDPGVSEYFDQIKYLTVDEYQDIDDLQEMLIRSIALKGSNICVVGDDDQTIYQFRGSNASNMISFAKRYKDVVTINLDRNYRSGKAILDVANSVISNNQNRLQKNMVASRNTEGIVTGECLDGAENEYESLVKDIKALGHFIDYDDMAVLLRKRSRLSELTRVLSEAGIPFHADESDEFFDSIYYRKFCNVFLYLEKQSDDNKKQVINDWKHIAGKQNLKGAMRYLSRCSEKNERFVVLFERFGNELGFDETDRFHRYYKGFIEILADFDQVYFDDSWTVRTSDFNLFIKNMAETEYQRTSLLEKKDEHAVQIMTVHQSKGLEFDAVFIPDMQQGFFPSGKVGGKKYYSVLGGIFEEQKSKYESDLEDERKLFYVALTRAKDFLYVYADVEKREASDFLKEMNESEYCNIMIPENTIERNSKELWQIYDMKSIRKAVYDELIGAFCGGGFGGAMIEFEEAKSASDEELLRIARSNFINIEQYRK